MTAEDALAFDRHLDATAQAVADGVDLPDPDGRIEGTGKRVRHIKARSVEDARVPWLRAAIAGQLAHRAG